MTSHLSLQRPVARRAVEACVLLTVLCFILLTKIPGVSAINIRTLCGLSVVWTTHTLWSHTYCAARPARYLMVTSAARISCSSSVSIVTGEAKSLSDRPGDMLHAAVLGPASPTNCEQGTRRPALRNTRWDETRQGRVVWHARARHRGGRGWRAKVHHTSNMTCMSRPHLWELLTALLVLMGTNLHGAFSSPSSRGGAV